MQLDQSLPEPLPAEPLGIFVRWFTEARELTAPYPDAMVLATIAAGNQPTGRVLLCKRIVSDPGYVVFFTNYNSTKGHELQSHARACAVFYWNTLHRQVRIEGPVVRSPAHESDEYFATRPFNSRIGAWASQQSAPLPSRAALGEQVRTATAKLGLAPEATEGSVPRPAHWGGYRLWIDSVELWLEGLGRIHDRALWTRDLQPQGADTFSASPWRATRLNP